MCKRAEGSELKGTCTQSCETACSAALDKWEEQNKERTGFKLLDKDRARLIKSCTRDCGQDCLRPGKAYDFSIPYRK